MATSILDNLLDQHKFWWSARKKDEEPHTKIVDLVERIINEQDYVRSANLKHLHSYSKRDYTEDGNRNILPAGPSPYIGVNATRSGVDTIVAKVTQQDPRPHFKTEGGNWNQRRRARKLQKFIDGLFYQDKFYKKARRAFKDAAIFGTGFLKPRFEAGKITWERVWPGSVIVDEASAMNGNTKSMFQVENIPIETLLAKFPKSAPEISSSNLTYKTTGEGNVTTMVRVYEAWHLKDIHGKGGRHAICIDSCTLLDEEYTEDFEPIVKFTWTDSLAGYYGHGVVEDVAPLQREMDYIMNRIQVATHNGANVWLMKPRGCDIPNTKLTNKLCSIVEYTGEPPQFYHSQIMNQQIFDHVKWLNELIYNVSGVSAMSATSQKPKGIESGKALQTMLDVESQRFAEVQKNYEQFIITCTKVCMALGRKHYTGGKSDYQVRVDSGKFTETIKWKDVNMAEDEYVLKVWPTNMLPETPQGKMEWVERMMQAGLVDAMTGMMLLDFPDVEAQQTLLFSAIKQALWIVDQVLYEDREVEPKEWYDLARCIKYMQMGMSNAEIEGAPPEVMERGMDFIAGCEELLTPPAPPAPEMDPLMNPSGMPPEALPPEMAPPGGAPPPAGPAMPPPGGQLPQ